MNTFFSAEAIELLDRMAFDPSAKAQYDLISGGLFWSDEFPLLGQPLRIVFEGDLPRFVLAYRAVLTLGERKPEFHLWTQLNEQAPHWPGLRPERRGEDARKRLLAAMRRETKCLEELELELDQPGTASS